MNLFLVGIFFTSPFLVTRTIFLTPLGGLPSDFAPFFTEFDLNDENDEEEDVNCSNDSFLLLLLRTCDSSTTTTTLTW